MKHGIILKKDYWKVFNGEDIVNCKDKIESIKKVFDEFYNGDDDLDIIDVCMRVESIVNK